MFPAYINAINSTASFDQALNLVQQNLLNANTFGYQEQRQNFVSTDFGVIPDEPQLNLESVPPAFMKGEKVTKLFISKEFNHVYFVTQSPTGSEYLTRLGDFKYTRRARDKNTYIGEPNEERTYLTTRDGYYVIGQPIGKGPLLQDKRYQDPYSNPSYDYLGKFPIFADEKQLNPDEPYQYGPPVPIDLTRDKNGLVLGRYREVRFNSSGVLEGFRGGVWVPLYKVSLVTVDNPQGLAQVNTVYRQETEESGLRKAAPDTVQVRPETVEKSNVTPRLSSYTYKKYRWSLNLALSLQRSNNRLMEAFQQVLSS